MNSTRILVRLAAVAAVAAAPLAAGLAPAQAAPAPTAAPTAQAAYSCHIDSYGEVKTADWLKVHTSPSTTSSTVGQVKRGVRFYYCSSSARYAGGHYWVYGHGANGSTTVTGWVASEYLAHP